MVALRTLLLVPLLTASSACFQEPDALAAPAAPGGPLSIELRDARGARYDPAEAPRDLAFALAFARPPAADETPFALYAGALSPELAPRLHAERGRAALRAAALPLSHTSEGTLLKARPPRALDGGSDYTLVWFGRESASVHPLHTSLRPDWGARYAESLPGAEESGVPRNLRALVRFEGALAADALSGLRLRDEHAGLDASIQAIACEELGFPAGHCAWVAPAALLSPRARHQLVFGASVQSTTGAQLTLPPVLFATGDDVDRTPPALAPLSCAEDEQPLGALCVVASDRDLVLRGAVDEPAIVTLVMPPGKWSTSTRAGEFTLEVPARAGPALLRVVDRAANVHEAPLALAPVDTLDEVLIDELRADPLGREPAQEYVELLNTGERPVALAGFSLASDGRGRGIALVSPLALAPGERALLVAPDFVLDDRADGELPSGARVVRLASALSLSNAGGTVLLRDALGRRLSAVRYRAGLVEGQCSARDARHRTQRAPTPLALDPRGGCTPGAATFPEP